jgi:hypothetical protein
MCKTTLVIGETISLAQHKLDLIVGEMKYKDLKEVNKTRYSYNVKLKNGDQFLAVSAENQLIGLRFDKALIEENVDNQIIKRWILPYIQNVSDIEYWKAYE